MYLSRNSKKTSPLVKNVYIAVGCLVILFILFFYFSSPIGGVIYTIGKPFWLAQNAVSERFATFKLNLIQKKQLALENASLKAEIVFLQTQAERTKIIENENEAFKSALNRSEKSSSTLASLLVKPPFSPYDTCIIDIGLDHNISIGDAVFVQGNVIIGKVSAVYAHTSQITLFSSPGQKFDVIVGAKNVSGQAEGKGGGNFQITLPKNAEIKKGDAVIMPSLTTDVYGIVDDIENLPNDSFIQVYFRNPVSITELRFIQIEKK